MRPSARAAWRCTPARRRPGGWCSARACRWAACPQSSRLRRAWSGRRLVSLTARGRSHNEPGTGVPKARASCRAGQAALTRLEVHGHVAHELVRRRLGVEEVVDGKHDGDRVVQLPGRGVVLLAQRAAADELGLEVTQVCAGTRVCGAPIDAMRPGDSSVHGAAWVGCAVQR